MRTLKRQINLTIIHQELPIGYYQNIKCGSCKYSFTDGYTPSNGLLVTYLGVPYIKCPQCNKVNKTGLKPYSTFHFAERIYHWFALVVRTTIIGLMLSVPGMLVIAFITSFVIMAFTESIYEVKVQTILWTAPIISLLFVLYKVNTELKEIARVEQEYKRIT